MANAIAMYRRAQRHLRDLFDPFTRQYCHTCTTPCCRKPAKVRAVDVMLAAAHGFQVPEGVDPEREIAQTAMDYLNGSWQEDGSEPCDFLGERGCTFPNDLRPYECAAWICPVMRQEMPATWLKEAEQLTKKLALRHEELLAALLAP